MAHDETEQQPSGESAPVDRGRALVPGLIRVLVIIAGVGIAFAIGAAVIPRWWAQRVGGVIDGSILLGSFVGIVVGLVFTLLPLMILSMGWRYRDGLKRGVVFIAIAAILALPNLATLGIVMGNGNGAHAGDRILDVEGPGFRGGCLLGAILGALVFIAAVYLISSRRRNRDRARDLSRQARESDQR